MKVLVIGSGGREHALAWRLAQSPRAQKIYVAPGNGATAADDRFENVALTVSNQASAQALAVWAVQQGIGLTVVGPEVALAAGVVDVFRAQGLRIFGPTRAAAQLESSKDFSKAFMLRHSIPTAAYRSFTDARAAHAHVNAQGAPIVVKADGLAAGKGVVVAMTLDEAHAAIDAMLSIGGGLTGACEADNTTSDAIKNASPNPELSVSSVPPPQQARVVIEEFLSGEEASFIVMTDGKTVIPMASSQDHKRLLTGDLGPNTGGMGAYSPAPVVTPEVHARALREVIWPAIKGMEKDGIPYSGFLYAGLMISPDGKIKTLEFNCRLGDPETQPILLRLKSDLLQVLYAATEDQLSDIELEWDRRYALGVVMAAAGYPAEPRHGDLIMGLPTEKEGQPNDAVPSPEQSVGEFDFMVFQAGTALEQDGRLQTAGGRVLCATVLASTLKAAQQHALALVERIHFDGAQYRKDIGHRAQH
jgi:phosphoribosylamine---glycine ligase